MKKINYLVTEKKAPNNRLIRTANKVSLDYDGKVYNILKYKHQAWAAARNSPFIGYIYNSTFIMDMAKLSQDRDWFDLCFILLEHLPKIKVLRLSDSSHLMRCSGLKTNQPNERLYKAAKTSGSTAHNRPDTHEVTSMLSKILPLMLAKHKNRLVHVEINGINLPDWAPVLVALKDVISLRRLYFRHCNLGDKNFGTLVSVLNCISVRNLTCIGCGITKRSEQYLSRLLHGQASRRDEVEWRLQLRNSTQDASRPVWTNSNGSLSARPQLEEFGLVSLDLSENNLGDEGIVVLARTLTEDIWLKALNIRHTGFKEEGMRAILQLLHQNYSLICVRFASNHHLESHFLQRNDPRHASRVQMRHEREAFADKASGDGMLFPLLDMNVADTKLTLPFMSFRLPSKTHGSSDHADSKADDGNSVASSKLRDQKSRTDALSKPKHAFQARRHESEQKRKHNQGRLGVVSEDYGASETSGFDSVQELFDIHLKDGASGRHSNFKTQTDELLHTILGLHEPKADIDPSNHAHAKRGGGKSRGASAQEPVVGMAWMPGGRNLKPRAKRKKVIVQYPASPRKAIRDKPSSKKIRPKRRSLARSQSARDPIVKTNSQQASSKAKPKARKKSSEGVSSSKQQRDRVIETLSSIVKELGSRMEMVAQANKHLLVKSAQWADENSSLKRENAALRESSASPSSLHARNSSSPSQPQRPKTARSGQFHLYEEQPSQSQSQGQGQGGDSSFRDYAVERRFPSMAT